MLGVFGLSIPSQEYDLERAICTQGHLHARVSSKFLLFFLYTHCHPHIASTISFSMFFSFFLCFLFILFRVCRRAHMQHIRTSHPPPASVSSFFMFLFFVYTHPCLHACTQCIRTPHPPSASVSSFFFCLYSSVSARTHAIPLHTRVFAHVEVHSYHNVSPYLCWPSSCTHHPILLHW